MSAADETSPGPIDLMESAKSKYALAQARARRGPPELALLSIHGSLEDILRAHALRRRLPAAGEPFPQLLAALAADPEAPLEEPEAAAILRMHRVRARVAHGEQLTVTADTIRAYQRLAARLLGRFGVVVVAPDDLAGEPEPGSSGATTVRMRREQPTQPRRERSVYPDDEPARPRLGRPAPRRQTGEFDIERISRPGLSTLSQAGRYPPPARPDSLWGRHQNWLLPGLIVVAIFLIGAALSIGLQQMRNNPLPAPLPTVAAPAITTIEPVIDVASVLPSAEQAAPSPAASATAAAPPPGALAPGQTAFVTDAIPGLNLRASASLDPNTPILLALSPGTAVEVIAGPVQADGIEWWQVRAANIEGWCAGEFLELR